MSDKPSKGRVLDYSMRWGIECMFSDFKSRGFGITQSKLQDPVRLKRLLLAMAIALILATFIGIQYTQQNPQKNATKKKVREASAPTSL